MNQVMINAVELDTLMQEIKDLKAEVLRLKRLLSEEQHRVKLLTAVKPVLDSSYPDGDGYWQEKS